MTVAARDASPPRVRPVEPTDLLAVYRLEKRCFDQPWPFEAFQSHVEAPGFLVAIEDGRVIGYVVGACQPGFPGPTAHIKDLAVHPGYRRRGIARQLLAQSLMRLREAGAVRSILEVREHNEPAIELYRSAGYSPAQTRPGYYADGEAAIVMTRRLD